MSRLCLVPTPIGNLEDITLRSLNILKQVSLVLAEDTRKTGNLLKHYQINKPLLSYHKFNEHRQLKTIISRLKAGESMALVSNAGTPVISDPGFLLVRECIRQDIPVECLPGPVAFVPAWAVSGIPGDLFLFAGFLPHKKGRKKRINQLAECPYPILLYESPYRLIRTLQDLLEVLGDRPVSVSRELTKIHEETLRGKFTGLIGHFKSHPPKGEFVLAVGTSE